MTFIASDSYSDGRAPDSSLARLRLGDEIFSSRDDTCNDAGAGFIIIRRGEVEPLPRPPGPVRQAARLAG